MQQAAILALLNNAALLVILSIIYELTYHMFLRTRIKQAVIGILVALTCIAIMSVPFKLIPGVVFDTRSILISVTALIFGPVPTIITIVLAIAYRLLKGGIGIYPGVAVILTSAVIGLLWRKWLNSKAIRPNWHNVYFMGLIVHIIMMACMLLLPYPDSITVIREITLPVIIIYPVATVLLCLLLTKQQVFWQIRDELKQSEERFRLLFDRAPLAYQSMDIEGKIVDVNQQWLNAFGYIKEEVIGKHFGDFLNPAYKDEYMECFYQLKRLGQVHKELEILHKNGNGIYISFDGSISHDQNRSFILAYGILRDITEQKKAEMEVRQSELKYRQLIKAMAQGVICQGTDGKILSANPEAEKILGLTLEQLKERKSQDPNWKTIYEDGSEMPGTEHPSMVALRTGKPCGPVVLGVFQPKLNSHVWLSVNATPIIEADGTLSQVYTIFQDITAEKKAKQDYQLLFDSMADGFALHEIICDRLGNPVDYRFLAVNPAFERIVEKKASDIIGKTVREVFPDIEPYWIQTYGKVALTGKSVMFESYAAPTGKHFRVTAYQPAPMQFACTFSDDTLRVESEKKYSSYIENAPYAVTVVDENGNFLESNKAASIITGYSREQLMSMNIRDISAAKCLKEAADHFELLLKKGKMSAELKYRHNDGSVRWWAVDAVKLSDNRFLVFSIDITDRKQAEEELINLNQRDYLTGIYNRRYFETELKRMDEDNILPLSVIIADINGVKIINDAFGHTAGDKHIIETASILKSCCRSGDVLARIGGDEFAILMPNTDHNAASEVLRNIQAALGEFDAVNSGNAYQHSVSLGCATKVSANDDMKEIIKVAEGYMYQRKLLEHNSVHSTIVSSIKATMFEKSHETEEHAQRLVALSKAVGIALDLPQAELDKLELLASLHDIGKVGVRDDILTKPGELNEMEWAEVKRHPEIGYRIAKTTPELAPIAEGILCHHEYWDGSGYPQGLSGESIPLLSRIVAVADAYDAMVNDRPYRKALDHNEAINRIKQKAGVQFDPHIVNIFIEKVPDHSYYV